MRKKLTLTLFFLILTICILFLNIFETSLSQTNVEAGNTGDDDIAVVSTEDVSSYKTNIVNGSFEEPNFFNPDTGSMWIASKDVVGWKTTATDQKIEVGWLKNGQQSGADSMHMPTVSSKGGAEGHKFIQTVNDKLGSTYQAINVKKNETYKWQFSHRGRVASKTDTVAMFMGPAPSDLSYLDKPEGNTSVANKNDIFYQMVSWLKTTKGVTAPENNVAITYTIYTTEVDKNTNQLSTEKVTDPFSESADINHTQCWKITLFSSDNSKWNTVTGNYTANCEQVIMAFAPFENAKGGETITHYGNLLDAIFVYAQNEVNLIDQSSFENITFSEKWTACSASNSSKTAPTEGIGNWRTTAIDRKIQVGIYDDDNNAYQLPAVNSYPTIRDGTQFAELNANEESSLYQYIHVKPKTKYNWSLSHRGRNGVDTMALIIGPKQDFDPKKKNNSKGNRDQLMQIVDWLKKQTDVVIDNEDIGCSQKITLYTSKFDENGGFTSTNPCSWEKDDEHTEKWCVWIISSDNDIWYDYGANDKDAQYSYSYFSAVNEEESIFSFVSYCSAPKKDGSIDLTYGNLLDNIQFDVYYHIMADSTPAGQGSYQVLQETVDQDFNSSQEYSGWALSSTSFRIVAKESDRNFLGAIINDEFVDVSNWVKDPNTNQYYYDINDVDQYYVIRLIFAAEKVIYYVNGGNPYHYDASNPETGYEIMLNASDEYSSYTSHTATSDKDGWRFMGWQFTNKDSQVYTYAAEHTIKFVSGESTDKDTLKIEGNLFGTTTETVVDGISAKDGITMIAQWFYRQRYVTQLLNSDKATYQLSPTGGTIKASFVNDVTAEPYKIKQTNEAEQEVTVGSDYYVLDNGQTVTVAAQANDGYRFVGWYDAEGPEGNLISKSATYSYQIYDRLVKTLYARFDPIGHDLKISKTISNVDNLKEHFGVIVTLSNLKENTEYKILNETEINVPTIGGEIISNPTFFKSDDNGDVTLTFYIKAGQTTILKNLPDGTQYTVREIDYTSYGYQTVSGNVDEPLTLNKESEIEIVNKLISRKLTVTSLGCAGPDDESNAVKLKNSGFTLYSDSDCENAVKVQQLTGNDGVITFAELEIGKEYYMKETRTPSGYGPNGTIYHLKVQDDGIYQVLNETDGTTMKKLDDGKEDESVIFVYNYILLSLPDSGVNIKLPLILGFGVVQMIFMIFWIAKRNIKLLKR